ncbi:MAG: hypothetical protein IMZ64_01145 [Bacteroidetes bacterium]|nr:hypothetical protein [Bacteroidota bacterium]
MSETERYKFCEDCMYFGDEDQRLSPICTHPGAKREGVLLLRKDTYPLAITERNAGVCGVGANNFND